MVKITFNDPEVGEVDFDELECYEDIVRSDHYANFVREDGEIPLQEDRIRLRFKNGSTKELSDLSAIFKLEGLGLSKCGDE